MTQVNRGRRQGRTTLAVGILLALLVMINACARAERPPEQTPTTSALDPSGAGLSTSTRPTAAPRPESTAQRLTSLLARRDPTPEGVSEQLAFAGGGAGPGDCDTNFVNKSEPYGFFMYYEAEAPVELIACFYNFAPDRRIELELALPDGTREQAAVRTGPTGTAGWARPVLHEGPLGGYELAATQGQIALTVTTTILPASRSFARIIPGGGPAGTEFRLAVAGYKPYEHVVFDLYQDWHQYAVYLTTLSVATDERGDALVAFPTSTEDMPGRYYLNPRSASFRSTETNVVVSGALQTGQGTRELSLIARRDSAPPGVEMIHRPYPSACAPEAEPMITVQARIGASNDQIEHGESAVVCFVGFAPAQKLQFTIGAENGETWPGSILTDFYGTARMVWYSLADEPVGLYTITAAQGGITTLGSFQIYAPTQARLLALTEHSSAGQTIEFALAGFSPNARVRLQIYKGIDRVGLVNEYITSTFTQVDAQGQGTFTLATHSDDPTGSFVLVAAKQELPDFVNYDGSFGDGVNYVPLATFVLDAAPLNVVPARGPAGRDFRVKLSGVVPYQPEVLRLFRRTSDGDEQLAILPVWANEWGSAELQLFTLTDDPPGEYVVMTSSGAEKATFVVDPPELP